MLSTKLAEYRLGSDSESAYLVKCVMDFLELLRGKIPGIHTYDLSAEFRELGGIRGGW